MSRIGMLVALSLAICCLLTLVGVQQSLATVHEIQISNFTFTPTNTTVTFGDTVRWTLVNGVHTSTSDPTSPKSWDSGTMSSPGQQYEVVFDEPDGFGPFPYHCNIHPTTMKDTIFYAPPSVPALTKSLVTSGLDRPVFATLPPGDFKRFFVLEQHLGKIMILDLTGDTLYARPFLDIGASISGGNEQGLLGLAFHPDFASNGYFYIDFTNTAGDTRIVRYQVPIADPDSADPGTADTLLRVDQPFSNHNGGWIAFGADGYLYISMGDGGSGGDPSNRAQDTNLLLGKQLRIDVDGGSPYAIPPDNPFAGGGGAGEVWNYGLRNPWRCSFDRLTHDLYIGDVGQSDWEEVSFQDADTGGVNFGWRLKEGTHCYNPSTNCDPSGITTDPIYEYPHSPECSITGGYVYRGCAIPSLQGTYFFSDYCSGGMWTFRYDGTTLIDFQDRTTELGTSGLNVVSFAEDSYGELYFLTLGGEIYKIVPDAGVTDCNMNGISDSCEIEFGQVTDANSNGIPDECESSYTCGDADGNSIVNISDAVYLIAYIFGGGNAPNPLLAGDADCNGIINISDAVYLIAYIFGGGSAPCASCS